MVKPLVNSGVALRRARPEEARELTALALRSKRHWGYDEAFMAAAAADMEIGPELIARAVAVVAERGGEPRGRETAGAPVRLARELLGCYVLCVEPEGPTLRDLWVEPAAIGTGVGALLWKDMLVAAGSEGFRAVRVVSDPNAAGFYAKMGARRTGEVPSCVIPGRTLPAFEIEVPGAFTR